MGDRVFGLNHFSLFEVSHYLGTFKKKIFSSCLHNKCKKSGSRNIGCCRMMLGTKLTTFVPLAQLVHCEISYSNEIFLKDSVIIFA